MHYTVVIPAAGEGKRMNAGKNKLLLPLDGKPIFIHTLSVFEQDEWCTGIILVVHPEETEQMAALLERFHMTKVIRTVTGGARRQDSVYQGLRACGNRGVVLIHDGARPFVTVDLIRDLTERAAETGAAIPAVPAKDTIKTAEGGVVTGTLKRSSLWAVQTPQAFRLSLVKKAYENALQAGVAGTDDASLVEHIGHSVSIVASQDDNIKITTPEDLVFARAILQQRRGDER